MNRTLFPALSRTLVSLALGAGGLLAALSSQAVVVHEGPQGQSLPTSIVIHSGVVNLPIAATLGGLYLNVVTGVNNADSGAVGGAVPGFDINLYGAGGLGFAVPFNLLPYGAYVMAGQGIVANLRPGSEVGPNQGWGESGSGDPVSQWNLNSSDNYFGFRFARERDGTVHYGWGQIAFGASIDERSLVQYAYEWMPLTPITVVPEPASALLLALGLARLAGLRWKRSPQA